MELQSNEESNTTATNDETFSQIKPPDSIKRNPVFVGNTKLPDLKRALEIEGVSTVFQAQGVMVCDDSVVVRKVFHFFSHSFCGINLPMFVIDARESYSH